LNITVRRAEIGDTDAIIGLLLQIADLHYKGRPDIFKQGVRKYGKDEFEEILKDETRPIFVATDGSGNFLGYCFCMIVSYKSHVVFKDHSTLYIDDFCIAGELRGQGIGKKLFAEVKEYAKQIGVYNIDLNAWEFNKDAVKFYESCGFTTQRRRMELIV
jgi:ribosomal protein S18 acetylase RimI-like enzyme